MSVKISYNYREAHEHGEDRHAQVVMWDLGFDVIYAEPNSMDGTWLFEVRAPHRPLPPYVHVVDEAGSKIDLSRGILIIR